MLTPEETNAIFMGEAEDMLYTEAHVGAEAWRRMARRRKRTGHYADSIDIVNVHPAARSIGIDFGSTLSYAHLLEEGHAGSEASGRALGNSKRPWPDKRGLTQGLNTSSRRISRRSVGRVTPGSSRMDAGRVFRKTSGPAKPARFMDRVQAEVEPQLRLAVRASGREIRNRIVADLNAHSEFTV
jgi:hypothetical protein